MAQVEDRNLMDAGKLTSKTAQVPVANGLARSGRQITAEGRCRMIAEAAYYRALQRGFEGGSAADDWLVAEREIDQRLLSRPTEQSRAPAGGERVSSKAGAMPQSLQGADALKAATPTAKR
jgi:hypothetical protein